MYDVSGDSLCFDSTYSSHRAPHIIYLVYFDPTGEMQGSWAVT